MTSFLTLIFGVFVALQYFDKVSAQPTNWWKETKGLAIESSEQLDNIIDN